MLKKFVGKVRGTSCLRSAVSVEFRPLGVLLQLLLMVETARAGLFFDMQTCPTRSFVLVVEVRTLLPFWRLKVGGTASLRS